MGNKVLPRKQPLGKRAAARLKLTLNRIWAARHQWMLVVILIALFVLQTQVFNAWLHLKADFSPRRLWAATTVGIFFFAPAIALHRRARYIWLVISSVLLEALFIAQFIYYLSLDTFIRASAIKYASYAGDVGGAIKLQIKPPLLFFGLMLPVIGLWYFLVERKDKPRKYKTKHRFLSLLLVLVLVAITAGLTLQQEKKVDGNITSIFSVPYDSSIIVNKLGVTAYSLIDTVKYFSSPRGISKKDKQFVKDWAAARPASTASSSPTYGIAKGKNVILVQMESFENFVLNRKIDGQEITPNLNALIKDSLYYSNYHDQVSTGRTADGEFETQNSLLPTMDQVPFFEYATHNYTALPKVLDMQGYTTSVMHGDVPAFWNRNVAYPYLGWEKYYNLDSFKVNRPVGWGLSDEDLVNQALPKLEAQKQPFYTNIITVSSHTPFEIPKDLQVLQTSSNHGLSDYQMNYIQSTAYTDKQLGVLIDGLKKNGLYDSSIIALFGDHRGFISDKNDTGFAKFVGLDNFNQATFFRQGEHIPLIIHVPGGVVKGASDMPASHLDFMPTILSLLGVPTPRTALGQDLLSTKTPVAIERNSAGAIQTISTPGMYYTNPGDGSFASGQCTDAKTMQSLPLNDCKAVYDQQSALAKVSDLVVRGNAVDLLK